MALADLRGGWLFELLPDVFPGGRLTEIEIELWSRYFDEKNQRTRTKNG
jgi:hypothetical protein